MSDTTASMKSLADYLDGLPGAEYLYRNTRSVEDMLDGGTECFFPFDDDAEDWISRLDGHLETVEELRALVQEREVVDLHEEVDTEKVTMDLGDYLSDPDFYKTFLERHRDVSVAEVVRDLPTGQAAVWVGELDSHSDDLRKYRAVLERWRHASREHEETPRLGVQGVSEEPVTAGPDNARKVSEVSVPPNLDNNTIVSVTGTTYVEDPFAPLAPWTPDEFDAEPVEDPAQRCLRYALELVSKGYKLTPVILRKDPEVPLKKRCEFPYDRNGNRLPGSGDPEQVRDWWAEDQRRSFAVDVYESGVEIVDLDVDDTTGETVGANNWADRPRGAFQVGTQSGGEQLYFRRRNGEPDLGDSSGRITKVDTRGGVNGMAFAAGAWLIDAPDRWYQPLGAIVAPQYLAPVPDAVIAAVGKGVAGSGKGSAPSSAPRAADDPFAPLSTRSPMTDAEALAFAREQVAKLASCAAGTKHDALRDRTIALGALGASWPSLKDWAWREFERVLKARSDAVSDWQGARKTFEWGWARGLECEQVPRREENVIPFPTAGAVESDAPKAGDRKRLNLLNRSAMRALPMLRPLIDGVLTQGVQAMIVGKDQSYKSFVALDWSLRVATGTPWFGHEVEGQRRVLYIAAEGAYGIDRRIAAWERHNGIEISDDYFLMQSGAVQLNDAQARNDLYELVMDWDPALVVLDTLHQSTAGLEENSSGEMGIALAAVRSWSAKGATSLVVHHTGHDGAHARGSSALGFDIDESFLIERGNDTGLGSKRTLHHTKAKDGILFDSFDLTAKVIDTGLVDYKGRPVTSLVMLPPTPDLSIDVGWMVADQKKDRTWQFQQLALGEVAPTATLRTIQGRLREVGATFANGAIDATWKAQYGQWLTGPGSEWLAAELRKTVAAG